MDTLVPLNRRADRAYLDFVEGVRAFALDDQSHLAAAARALRSVDPEAPLSELKQVLDPLPSMQMHKRLMRSQQEMKWQGIVSSLDSSRDRLERELDDFAGRQEAKLVLDPQFKTPAYANVHFHLQPTSYYKDSLAGFMYHHGTKVFFRGDNDKDQLHALLVGGVEPPAEGAVTRVLDLACSVGQSTTALKARFPEASVVGIDHSEPMLRAAHRRAVMLGSDVTFQQALAEASPFPDGSFDLIFAFILFHELPLRVSREVAAEVARQLRPGGVFVAYDFIDSGSMSAVERYRRDFDARHNGEPYSQAFCDSDFSTILGESGLQVLSDEAINPAVKRWRAIRNPAAAGASAA